MAMTEEIDVRKFREEVGNADAIILGTPEYHGAYSDRSAVAHITGQS